MTTDTNGAGGLPEMKECPMRAIYDLAIECGAEVDGGDYPDYSSGFPGSAPTITFTERQLEAFAAKIADRSWVYRPMTLADLPD